MMEAAVLAGGCFWGLQELFRALPGVVATRVGYTDGEVVNPTYRNHGGHAESVEITYDPSKTSYRSILEFFFQVHDPTTLNRHGDGLGTSYRSAIFYVGEEQSRIAAATIADVSASGLWPRKVITEVVPAGTFWEAEPEHQNYLRRYSGAHTCHYVRLLAERVRRAVPSRMWPPRWVSPALQHTSGYVAGGRRGRPGRPTVPAAATGRHIGLR